MSAVVGEPAAGGAQKYVNFDEYVDFQVNKTRAGIRSTDLLQAVVTVLLVVAAYLLLFVVADQWVIAGGFSDWMRIGLLSSVVAFIGLWTTWKIVLPYWKRVTALYAAKELEGTQPQLKSSLLTLVDLKQAGRPVSSHILTAMEKRAALQLSQIDVEQAVDRRPLMRLAYALLGIVVALCLYTVLSPKPVGASLLRALIPVADIGVATRTQIVKVDPGATSILARSQLEVTVDVRGEIPPEATLLYTTHDRSLVDEAVVLRDTGEGLNRFRGTLSGPNGRGLLQDFTYRVVAGDAGSETFPVRVNQAPYATVESVTYTYPQYMGLDPQTQSGGDIEAWEGTKVTLRGVTNMPVATAVLKFHETEDISARFEEKPLRLTDSTHFELTWTLQFQRDGASARFYQVDLRTEEGQRDPVPRLYSQVIRRDLPPEIKLLHPSGDISLPANAVLPLSFAARDPDFMLRSIRLKFEHREMPLEAKARHLYDAPPYRPEVQGQAEIRLSDFESVVKPGDVLTFYLEAWDNMAPLDREGNRSVTPKININITPEESREQIEQRREQEAQAAQRRLDEAQSPQTPERGDGDAQSEEPAGEDPPGESTADENPQPESGEPSEQAGGEPPAGDQNTNNDQATGQQGTETSDAQQSQGAQQQQGEKTPQGAERPSPGDGESGQPSKGGNAQSSPKGADRQQKPGNQAGSQPGAQQQRSQSQPQPGAEASDDEALAKLLNKYKDEIRQQREQEQQRDRETSQESQQGSGTSNRNESASKTEPQKSSDDQGNDGADSESGESNERTGSSDQSPPRSDGAKPRDPKGSEHQNAARDGGEQNGDSARSPKSEAPQTQPGEQPPPGEKPQTSGSNRDPRESQDPRTADQPQSQAGKPQPKSETGEPQQGAGNESQPMPGETDSSQSTSPSGQQSKGSGTPSADPSAEKSAGESGAKPDGAEGRPSNENADQTGEPEQSGSNDANSSETSRTGGQPKGANEPNPGEGRKGGQRSEQPQAGEQGSSQQTSEGQPSNQSGAGDSSDSPGSQSEGAAGQSAPGEGKQAGDKPGQSQSGSEGAEQGSGSQAQAGKKPGSGADSGQPEDKGKGQQGRSDESPAEDAKPGDSGASGDKPSGEGQKSGDKQSSSGGGEKPQGNEAGDKPSDAGGGKKPGSKPQGDKPQGGGEQGSESTGSGEQGGSESGGSESGSESGGGESGGGEPGEGSSSSSSDPGNSQQPGQPGSGQSAGGRVGAGGLGTNDGPAPQGSGGGGGSEAGPAEPADLRDRKKATELVLQKLQDEVSRGEVSPDLLQDLGWTEQKLRDFMDRLDRRLSDTGADDSPEATARRRQFDEILRGIDYESEGVQKLFDGRDRPVETGAGTIPRLPAPSEFRRAEESMRQKLSRETKSK